MKKVLRAISLVCVFSGGTSQTVGFSLKDIGRPPERD